MFRRKTYPINGVRICIDNQSEALWGRVYSQLFPELIPFEGINELLLKVDNLYDEVGYPQSFQEKRSFKKSESHLNQYKGMPKSLLAIDKILNEKGAFKTFDIVVITRRNASWQGYIQEVDSDKRNKFSGEMELIRFLT